MVAVRINGEASNIKSDGLPKITDLVELIKSLIDPDHMITSILLDGSELSEQDWSNGLSQHETSVVEIETGTPSSFVSSRLSNACEIVRECFWEFRATREKFEDGKMQEANKKLVAAVNTLQAFFEWYATLLNLVGEEDKSEFDISPIVEDIAGVCKQICQQQLYQSWWALGESLKNELEPKLDELEAHCRKFKSKLAA